MTTNNQISTIPVSVDYTSRDYYSIREQLIARIQARIPNWLGTDPADFGLALVEAFSYMGDMISYYIDRTANESSIYTATQRSSILNIANVFGYTPAGYRQASTLLTFSNSSTSLTANVTSASGDGTFITYISPNSFSPTDTVTITGFVSNTSYNVTNAPIVSASSTQFTVAGTTTTLETPATPASAVAYPPNVTIPAGTVVSGQVSENDVITTYYFTTVSDTTVVPGTSNRTLAAEGREVTLVSTSAIPTYGELIGTSDGSPNQSYNLLQSPVVDGSITLYVLDGDVYSEWTQVTHITDYGQYDLVYTVSTDANNVISINFGDGISGAIPVPYSQVRAMYTVGGGSAGNVPSGVLTNISYIPGLTDSQVTALKSIIQVINLENAVGGDDPESNDQIRISAPATLRAANRAVTLKDFNDLALTVSGVGKANATASTWSSVTLYLAPTRSPGTLDLQPGLDQYGSPSSELNTLSYDVYTFMEDKLLLGTSLTIQQPTYVDIALNLSYKLDPKYTPSVVDSLVVSTLAYRFGYTNLKFEETIYPQDIESVVSQIGGVLTAKVNSLYRFGNVITGAVATGSAVTYSTASAHGLNAGDTVTISGLSSAYDLILATVVSSTPTTFTVASSIPSGSSTETGSFIAYSTLVGYPNEIFRFQVGNITIGHL